jgi:hypothetical protein
MTWHRDIGLLPTLNVENAASANTRRVESAGHLAGEMRCPGDRLFGNAFSLGRVSVQVSTELPILSAVSPVWSQVGVLASQIVNYGESPGCHAPYRAAWRISLPRGAVRNSLDLTMLTVL